MKFLLVNADDFGLTAGVNRAVIEAHTRGIVTSATLLVNLPAFAAAVQAAQAHPTLGVGLHFNLTQGRPVAPPAQIPSLLNERGAFLGTSTALACRAIAGRLYTAEVIVELRAQLDKLCAAGLRPTHLDSHKHAHALPQVCAAVALTVGDYGIRAVRSPRDHHPFAGGFTSGKQFKQSVAAIALAQLSRVGERKLRRAGIVTPNACFGVAQTGYWTKQWLRDLIKRLPPGVSELMCHPGYVDDSLITGVAAGRMRLRTRLRESRELELKLLTDPEIVELLRRCGVQLISYAQLQ